jgi:hypothetical protein
MNDPEGFLSRWSRRKRSVGDAELDRPEAASPQEPSGPEAVESSAQETWASSTETSDRKKGEPAFDLSKLPSIESITAETDIRMFLAPGVPLSLTREALRRVWVVDPKIREFIEMAENQWDFTAPGVPGFDIAPPTGDIARMVREIFAKPLPTESTRQTNDAGEVPDAGTIEARTEMPAGESSTQRIVNEPAENAVAQESNPKIEATSPIEIAEHKQHDGAPQQDDALQNEDRRPTRRTHGSAVPR